MSSDVSLIFLQSVLINHGNFFVYYSGDVKIRGDFMNFVIFLTVVFIIFANTRRGVGI